MRAELLHGLAVCLVDQLCCLALSGEDLVDPHFGAAVMESSGEILQGLAPDDRLVLGQILQDLLAGEDDPQRQQFLRGFMERFGLRPGDREAVATESGPLSLEVEGLEKKAMRDFRSVEAWLKKLKNQGKHSFAILENASGAYVQVAAGDSTNIVEYGDPAGSVLRRAMRESGKNRFGRFDLADPEQLPMKDVVRIFHAFFEGTPWPEDVRWRDISGMLQGN